MSEATTRGKRSRVIGVVTSTAMRKTIVVRSENIYWHPRYPRAIRKMTVYKAHDEKGAAKVGDKVEIAGTRPLSKTKRWRLVRVVATGDQA